MDKTAVQYKEGSKVINVAELILNNLPSGIIFCDADCNILFINKTYADYIGVNQEEVIGKPILDYIPASRIRHVLETGKPELGFKCCIGEGKGKKILVVNRIPVPGTNGRIFGVISQTLFGDIGELKDLYERLELLERKVTSYREKIKSVLSAKYSIEDIKGQSADIVKAKELLEKYAKTEFPVLVLGATGTGKELMAHSLHAESERARGPFVSVNCAAIPHDLLESELFGYVQGAFTGAQKEGKIGQIELADRGTLFLDEIGEMSLQAQVKLLRVLEDKTVCRLGATYPSKVDFRLVAATSRDLKAMILEGKFREDLYYRLSTMVVSLPSLRERKEDIPLLVRHIIDRMGFHHLSCSREAIDVLKGYHWPGNIRELQNVIGRAASLCSGDVINVDDLPPEIVAEPTSDSFHNETFTAVASKSELSKLLSDSERKLILDALKANDWNMVKTAKMLGLSRATLYEKARKYQISKTKRAVES
ncbi:MAG: sigma 54-interacting transcriptional regulator [Nitrospirae bacterium]|nr:sigma 54-interacting transcriptional regulator [Nitrospirota bacterium]